MLHQSSYGFGLVFRPHDFLPEIYIKRLATTTQILLQYQRWIQDCCNIQGGALFDNSQRLEAVNYYHKELHLGWGSNSRFASEYCQRSTLILEKDNGMQHGNFFHIPQKRLYLSTSETFFELCVSQICKQKLERSWNTIQFV